MRNHFLRALDQIATSNDDFILLTGDLGYGVFETFAEKHPGKYLNCGILEQSIIGIASGLALTGRAVFIYSISNFITLRCLEQIRNDACYHDLNITIIGSGGGFTYGALGMSHHATEDLGVLRTLPNIDIVAPADATEVFQATLQLSRREKPGYLRLEKSLVETSVEVDFTLGDTRQIVAGQEALILTTGGILKHALDAAQKFGQAVEVHSLATIKPISSSILETLKRFRIIITVEEHNVINGLGSAIAELCMENAIYPAKFTRLGLRDCYSSIVGDQEYLRSEYGIDAKAIENVLKSHLDTR